MQRDLGWSGDPEEVVKWTRDEFKAKISQAINALADEGNFEEAGRPDRLRIEVVHRIPRPPFEDGSVYTINTPASMPRPLAISMVFVTRESRYSMPE